MKNNIYFLVFLILFQSCNAYKSIELNNYDLDKPKKVKILLKNDKRYDGKIIDFNNDEITLTNFKRKKVIPIAEIDKIKQPKFSILKTMGLTFIISLTIAVSGLAYFTNGFK
jgi:hypothetical protein